MSVVIFCHDPWGLGRLGDALHARGLPLSVRRLDLPLTHPTNQLAFERFPRDSSLIPQNFENVLGVISMGGPQNVGEDQHTWMPQEMQYLKASHEKKLPVVGICLGAQMIAAALGGKVGPMSRPELGLRDLFLANNDKKSDRIFHNLPKKPERNIVMYQSHGYEVKELPKDAILLASSNECKVQSYRVGENTFGFQFHPEFTRNTIEELLKKQADFLSRSGQTRDDVQQQLNKDYDYFEELAEQLCKNVAALF